MTDGFVVEPLAPHHDRTAFSCGVTVLDRYLRELARQDERRHLSNCFVAAMPEQGSVAGYYTFAASSISADELLEEQRRRLPRYSTFPAALIGRLAIDLRFRGRGLGAAMIYNAVTRARRADAAIFTLVVAAKDEGAANFYRHHDFRPFLSDPLTLYLPIGAVTP